MPKMQPLKTEMQSHSTDQQRMRSMRLVKENYHSNQPKESPDRLIHDRNT